LGPRTVTTVVTGIFEVPACGPALAERVVKRVRQMRRRLANSFRCLVMLASPVEMRVLGRKVTRLMVAQFASRLEPHRRAGIRFCDRALGAENLYLCRVFSGYRLHFRFGNSFVFNKAHWRRTCNYKRGRGF